MSGRQNGRNRRLPLLPFTGYFIAYAVGGLLTKLSPVLGATVLGVAMLGTLAGRIAIAQEASS